MPEEILCRIGHTPKILIYIDQEKNKYIQINCKLKDEINPKELKYFFSQVYQMKLDRGYCRSFDKTYSTRDLIECFKNILLTENIINLKKLYNVLDKRRHSSLMPAEYAIQIFFSMFDIIDINSYSIEEYKFIIGLDDPNTLFSIKEQMMTYNNELIKIEKNSSSNKNKIKIKNKNNKTMC